MKNTICEMKPMLYGLSVRLDIAQKRLLNLKKYMTTVQSLEKKK